MDQRILSLLLCGVGFFVPFSNALTNIFWVLALIYALAQGSFKNAWRSIGLPRGLILLYMLLLFFSLLSGLHAQSFSGLRHEPLVGIFLVLALGVKTQTEKERILWAFAFGTGLICLLGILQVAAGAGTPWWAKEPRWTHEAPEWLLMFLNSYDGRAVGTRGHPNTYGQFLAASLPLLLIWASSLYKEAVSISGKKVWMAWGIFSLAIFATLLSMSRTAWLAMLVLLPAAAMLLRRKDLLFGFLLIAGCAGLGALALTRLPADGDARTHLWKEKFSGFWDAERFAKWRVTVELIRRHPWLGVGPGKIREAYLMTLREKFPQNIVEKSALMGDPHNLYLRMACERGLPVLLLFLAFSFSLLRFLFIRSGGFNLSKARGSPVILGCALGIAAMFLCGMTESTFWDDEMVQGFWFLTGLSVCSSKNASGDGTWA